MENRSNKTVTFIYNPHAGPRRWSSALQRVCSWWTQRGWLVSLRPTESAGHATKLAKAAAAANEKLVIAVGGDGTLNEAVSGLVGSKTALGLIPAGTGNSFAKELGLPRSLSGYHLLSASNALIDGKVHAADIGISEDNRYWLLWSGVGADAYLVERIEPRSKLFKRLGKFGYLLQAFWYLPRFQPTRYEITVDGRSVTGRFVQVLICNCRFWAGGNIQINPKGVMDDGQFEIWCFAGNHPARSVYFALLSWLGLHSDRTDVILLQGQEIRIATSQPMPLHFDAEPSGQTPYKINLLPGGINLLIPPSGSPALFESKGVPLDKYVGHFENPTTNK